MDSGNPKGPNCRLCIKCSIKTTKEEFRAAFEKYGTIEEIWVVRDREGQPKGCAYIRFSKMSEAAHALEEMNGRCIGNEPRPLKITIAPSQDDGSKQGNNENNRLLRLLCMVPKTMTAQELHDHFSQFGDVDYVNVLKDKETKESKGCAFVKYRRILDAAKAYACCDRSFKAVFAEKDGPMPLPACLNGSSASRPSNLSSAPPPSLLLPAVVAPSPPIVSVKSEEIPNDDSCASLRVICSPGVNQNQLWRLFDIVPGLDYLHMDPKSGEGHAIAVYTDAELATHARLKLHGFEYPPGQRLIVKVDPGAQKVLPIPKLSAVPSVSANATPSLLVTPQAGAILPQPVGGVPFLMGATPSLLPTRQLSAAVPQLGGVPFSVGATPNLLPTPQQPATLAETLAQATSLIQAAGLLRGSANLVNNAQSRETYDPSYCTARLPPPQRLAPKDAEVVERLFIKFINGYPPLNSLKDVFGRYGNLIDVVTSGKKTALVSYASKESAQAALQALHGQDLCEIRMHIKVSTGEDKHVDPRFIKSEDE